MKPNALQARGRLLVAAGFVLLTGALTAGLLVKDMPPLYLVPAGFFVLGGLLGYLWRSGILMGTPGRSRHGTNAQIEQRFQHLADHDGLTGLFNRRRFELELADRLAGRGPRSMGAVLVLDLDNFRYINDTAGHKAGDELIKCVARLSRDRLRGADVHARLSADEFAILLGDSSVDRALEVAEDLVSAVRELSVPVGGNGTRVTTSVGVTLFNGSGPRTAEELLVEADLAVYEAKEGGRDRVALYASTRNAQGRMLDRLNWVERIRDALEHDRFTLYYQPILDLRSGRVSQYELLLRMIDEDGTIIPPAEFLGTAERFGLIQSIDRWVVREAIHLVEKHRHAGRVLRLEVNLSGKSVGDPELPALIERELAATKIDPSCLILEVTETAAIANMEDARDFAARVAELGCRFALDDFGTGFGSFYYLKHLPLDYLKIDGEFISGLPDNPTDQVLVKAMVQLADGLVEQTIAEFVGDRETVRLLREYGVDYAQGYHIGRPRPVAEIWTEAVGAAA